MKSFFRISRKDARLLLILLGGLVMFALYWFGARPLYERADAASAEADALAPVLAERQEHARRMERYRADADTFIDITKTETAHYPDAVLAEDWIRYADRFEKAFAVNIPAMTWTEAVEAVTELDVKPDWGAAVAHKAVLKAGMTCSFVAGYNEVKGLCGYIAGDASRTVIDAANFSYDSSTGLIMSNLQLAKYALADGQPAPRDIATNGGTRNPFGSLR